MGRVSYIKFCSLSTKARMNAVQKILIDKGYDLCINNIRDKQTVKAITDLQRKNGISPNGVICERTFNLLNVME